MSIPHLQWLETKHGVMLRPGWHVCVMLPPVYPAGYGDSSRPRRLFCTAANRQYAHWINGGPP